MRLSELYKDIMFVDRDNAPNLNQGNSNQEEPDDVEEFLEEEFTPPYDVMIDPSLLTSQRKLTELRNSPVLRDEEINLSVPASLVESLEQLDRYDIRRRMVISEFAGQAQQASGEEIISVIREHSIREFSQNETELPIQENVDFQWKNAFDGQNIDDYEYVRRNLEDTFAYLATASKLLGRISYSVDRLRDAGVRVVDIGKAKVNNFYGDALEDVYHPKLAKYCVFSVANSAPYLIDPVCAVMLQSSIDFTLYKIDP